MNHALFTNDDEDARESLKLSEQKFCPEVELL